MDKAVNLLQELDQRINNGHVLFFDLDGTLVDTNLANFLSYKKAIHEITKSDHDLIYNHDQRFNRGVLKKLFLNMSETQHERIIQEKERYFKDFLHETKLNKVVADILVKNSKTNKTVLVTNCRKDRALMILRYFRLSDNFTDIFYRHFSDNETRINKYKNAISGLHISPNTVIAFENEKSEINDAIFAGILEGNIISI